MDRCACMKQDPLDCPRGIDKFASMRVECAALREILVPDSIWPDFETWHRTPDYLAFHRSALLLAMERGTLHKLTAPVHRYLLAGGAVRSEVKAQYVSDLRENWMLSDDPTKRHRRFRAFAGKLGELLFADWLEAREWTTPKLEARGAPLDVVARSPGGLITGFEVKHIGVQDEDFEDMVRSFRGAGGAASVSPYDAANYLVFRAYEAAKQLQHTSGYDARVAVVIIPADTWHRFDVQLENDWIDWQHPAFLDGHDWPAFSQSQTSRYPDLTADLPVALTSIDAVWVLSDRTNGEFTLEYEVMFSRCVQPAFPADSAQR